MNCCDHGHMTSQEIRLLPYGKSGGNIALCRQHFIEEMKFTFGPEWEMAQKIQWDNLKIYEG